MSGVTLHWRKRAIYGDIARGGCGLALCVALLPSFGNLSFGQIVSAGLCALFGSYVFGAALKLASSVTINDDSVVLTRPLLGSKQIDWTAARSFDVRHFSIGQIQKKALMDCKISDGRKSIVLDDGLDNFQTALRHCWMAARKHDVGVSDTTMANLAAAGCATEAARHNG